MSQPPIHYTFDPEAIANVFDGETAAPLAPIAQVVQPSAASVITDLDEVRRQRQEQQAEAGKKKKKGEVLPSLDLRFVRQVDHRAYRIGGAVADQCDTGIYKWKDEAGVGAYWEAQPEHVLEDLALKFLTQAGPDKATARKTADLVKMWRVAWSADPQQTLPNVGERVIVPVRDAYLEITPEGVVAHRPRAEFGMTHAIPVALGLQFGPEPQPYTPRPLPEGSRFRRYLERVQPDEGVRGILQEAMGMTLLTNPSTNFQRAVWLQGDGGNGKSVMLDILRRFHPQHTAFDLANLDQRFGLACIKDKTLVVVAETPPKGFDENRFKSLVGRDLVTAERKHQDTFSFVPKATWVLSMNQTPAIRDSSHGFWRRVLPIPFDVQIPLHEMDRNLVPSILGDAQELAAVLDWMLEGAIRLLRRGDFPAMDEMPQRIKDLARTQRAESDSAVAFLEEYAPSHDPSRFYDKHQVYAAYAEFCGENGRHPQAAQRFWMEVRRRFKDFDEIQYTAPDRKRRRAVNIRFDGLLDLHHFVNGTTVPAKPAPVVAKPAPAPVAPSAPNPVTAVPAAAPALPVVPPATATPSKAVASPETPPMKTAEDLEFERVFGVVWEPGPVSNVTPFPLGGRTPPNDPDRSRGDA